MIDAGKAYNAANKQFVSGIRELAQQSTTDEVIEVNQQDDATENNLLKITCLYSNTVYFCWVCGGCLYLPSKIYCNCDQGEYKYKSDRNEQKDAC